MPTKELPSDYSKDLQSERIIEVASFLAKVRGEVIERHDEKNLGDTPLALGIRAYECCRSRLIKKDKSQDWSWFSILTPDRRFTFRIGDTPVRFVRTTSESLPDKKFIRSEEATRQVDWLSNEKPEASIHWFIVIDTYYKNAADSVSFIGYSDTTHEVIHKWEVPLEDKVTSLSDTNEELPQAIEIEKAPLKIKTRPSKKVDNDEK